MYAAGWDQNQLTACEGYPIPTPIGQLLAAIKVEN